MFYYYGIGKWLDEQLRNTRAGQAWEGSSGQDLLTGIQDKIKDATENVFSGGMGLLLGQHIGGIIGQGIKDANIGGLIGEALTPLKADLAKAKLDLLKGFQSFGDEIAKSWNKVDQAAFDFGKQVGLTQKQIESFRDSIVKIDGAVEEFGNRYGKTLDQLIKLQSDFAAQSGRVVRFTTEQFKNIAAISGIVGDEMAVKLTSQLDSFGMSTTAAGKMVAQMYNESLKKGITLQAYSKNVTENLHLAQQYTFKDGVKGLMSMAENAAKTKMDMQQIVSLGNKLAEGGVEGAVNMAADLQVLGGAFANFADPIGLLHDGLLDMEGLSNRLTDLVGKMGRFDKEQGRVVINPFQQMQLREASKTMGVDYSKLIESANQQAKRKEIETQMSGLGNIPEEYKELLMNTAQFQNGKAGVSVNGRFKELSMLTKDELVEIADLEKDVGQDVKEIKRFLIGAEDARKNQEAALENTRTAENAEKAKAIKEVYQNIGESKDSLKQIVKWQQIAAMSSTLNGIKNLSSPVFNLIGKLSGFFKRENGGVIRTHSDGDLITNGTPGKEYILNSAQHGEFIVNAKATKHHLGLLRAINGDKNGNLRFKQNEEGSLLNTLTTGESFGTYMPFMGGMGMMGNAYQLQLINGIQGKYQTYVDSVNGRFSKTQGLINARNNELNNIIDNAKKEQQRLINEQKGFRLTKQGRLQNKINLQNTEKEIARATAALESNTKHQETLNTTMAKTQSRQAKIAKIGRIGAGVAGSALAGLGAYTSAKAQYEYSGEAIMNKQKAQAGTIGATIGATAGAALGSFIGPIGTMIGGAIGQAAGQAIGEAVGTDSTKKMVISKSKIGREMDNALGSNKFMSIKGNFSVKEQKALASALNDGMLYENEIKDKDLITKLKETGNGHLIEKHARGGWIRGRSHSTGGEMIGIWGGKVHEAEDSEAIIPVDKAQRSTKLINGILNGIISDNSIKAIEPMGKQMKVNERYAQNLNTQPLKVEPINITINGSIKLETNDKTFDISNEIFKNPTLINHLTDLISKQMNIDEHFAFNRKTYSKKYTTL